MTIANYSETTQSRLDRNWNHLEILCNDLLITRLSDRDTFAKYQRMLNDLRQDRISGDPVNPVVLLGLKRAPASKDRHHDYEGGLVEHLLEMWSVWGMWKDYLYHRDVEHEHLTDANVWRAILHHDLNKVWRYQLINGGEPFIVDYYERDAPAALLGSTSKAMWILQTYNIPMNLLLTNALVCSEGGYSKTRPRNETVFAKLLYLLDEGSASVLFRLHTNRFWDSMAGGLNEETQAG